MIAAAPVSGCLQGRLAPCRQCKWQRLVVERMSIVRGLPNVPFNLLFKVSQYLPRNLHF